MLTFGNTKLAESVGIFNLPEIKTCPGRTPFCSRFCYAARRRCKLEGEHDTVTPHRANNLKLSRLPDFVERISQEIRESRVLKIRIHESGDFYDQEYLDKWIAVAKAFPRITFLAYTKSFDRINFSAIPANMLVYNSFDITSPRRPRPGERAAFVIPDWSDPGIVAPGYFVCPSKLMHRRGVNQYCGSKCVTCWKGAPLVALPQH